MRAFLTLITSLLSEGKTTGENHSESMLHYTNMNLKRMERWEKKGALLPELVKELSQINEVQNWVFLTEAWCGDAAHSLPFIHKMADTNENIKLEIKLRDENLELMDQYLTNGARSIPKLIAFSKEGKELFNWGPRPKHIQEAFIKMKTDKVPYDESSKELQKLYNKDKGETMQNEILTFIKK